MIIVLYSSALSLLFLLLLKMLVTQTPTIMTSKNIIIIYLQGYKESVVGKDIIMYHVLIIASNAPLYLCTLCYLKVHRVRDGERGTIPELVPQTSLKLVHQA